MTDTATRNPSEIKLLLDTQRSIEKARIAVGNRASALERGVDHIDSPAPRSLYHRLEDSLLALEAEVEAAMAEAVKTYPVWDHWLKHVRGIGPSLASQLLAMLLPPLPERGPSTWFKAAGLVPEWREDQQAFRMPRPRKYEPDETILQRCKSHTCGWKGQQAANNRDCPICGEDSYPTLPHYPWLRRCLYNVATSFVRGGGYYRKVYEQQKGRLFDLHQPLAAKLLRTLKSLALHQREPYLCEHYAQNVVNAVIARLDKEAEAELKSKKLPVTVEGVHAIRNRGLETYPATIQITGSDDPNWPLVRVDQVARWTMTRLFLSHLYEKWLEAGGHASRQPYVVEKLGHHYIAPPEPNGDGKI